MRNRDPWSITFDNKSLSLKDTRFFSNDNTSVYTLNFISIFQKITISIIIKIETRDIERKLISYWDVSQDNPSSSFGCLSDLLYRVCGWKTRRIWDTNRGPPPKFRASSEMISRFLASVTREPLERYRVQDVSSAKKYRRRNEKNRRTHRGADTQGR